jgi:hypothetical protein
MSPQTMMNDTTPATPEHVSDHIRSTLEQCAMANYEALTESFPDYGKQCQFYHPTPNRPTRALPSYLSRKHKKRKIRRQPKHILRRLIISSRSCGANLHGNPSIGEKNVRFGNIRLAFVGSFPDPNSQSLAY